MKARLLITALALGLAATGAAAREGVNKREPKIWKVVPIAAGETVWTACQRHFHNDVASVKQVGRMAHCRVPYFYANDLGDVRQNFN